MAKEIGTNDLIETWASTGNVIAPSLAKQNGGWEFEEQPPHEYMNWIHNTLGQQINYLMRSGVPAWNAATDYLTGNVVADAGVLWVALAPNANSQPAAANTNWQGLDADTFATAAQGALADTALQSADIGDFETSAQLDARDTANRARSNHTGTQAISTVTGLQTALDGKATAAQGALADTAVQPSRQIISGEGINGGGDLSADRTLNLRWATQAEAEAGVGSLQVMTPLRTKQAINAQAPASRVLALCAFDGTASGTIPVEANGINVANVTKNGTGDYTINFTTPLANANYVVTSNFIDTGAANDLPYLFYKDVNARTVNGVRMQMTDGQRSPIDSALITITVTGAP